MDLNSTVNLPQTEFPMRANLPKREPEMLEKWEKERLYYALSEKNKGKPSYTLHDGPPYANGNIHLGTALNKVLKDIIVKYKSMTGYNANYVPGWDCHGLPIELKAVKSLGVDSGTVDPVTLRKSCRQFALSCLDEQKSQFKRLGVWGDFDDPYLTISPAFEAKQVEVFGEMVKKGYIYKGLKPVYWCADCNTALAEAEIEYQDDPCYSIYVKFPLVDDKGKFSELGIDLKKAFVVIWTTTTWTLPGNLAICLGPNYEYTFVKVEDESSRSFGEYLLMATELVPTVMSAVGIAKYSTVGSFKGSDIELIETAHPFLPRKSPVLVGNHVTLDSGTGCVHTAPGFGVEDFEVCNKYKGMFEIIVPVNEKGVLTEEAGQFAGLKTADANKAIAQKLEDDNTLLAMQKIVHPYPHCWRCHEPIIYRATDQWFCNVDMFKPETIKAIEQVQWIPEWGEERIKNMVNMRSDWCISRQRRWGVPIPMLYCEDCGKTVINDTTIKAISDMFRAETSDAWYAKDASEFIPESVKCECGCGKFRKEMDIFDVWFDSGCTHAAVLKERPELSWPADMYLEGCDQYRGWFQSSLLTSVATTGQAPYKAVCTHGWVVDGNGQQMHKSKGNQIFPEEVIKDFGADVLRLWVASLDYHADIRVSKDMLKQLSESYRKIRNTARYILGNLGASQHNNRTENNVPDENNGLLGTGSGSLPQGFDPNTEMVPVENLRELDKWALARLDEVIDKVKASYEAFDYYLAYHALISFCVVDMSNFYLDIVKDVLYCDAENSPARKSVQTAMYMILDSLVRLVAPILCYTADEIWQFMPHKKEDDLRSVIFNQMPEKTGAKADEAKWAKIHAVRDDVLAALELKRAEKVIGKSLEARVEIFSDDAELKALESDLAEACIVSEVKVNGSGEGEYKGSTVSVTVSKMTGNACERCWTFGSTVGSDSKYPNLCRRCAEVIKLNFE
ncbi:MAG: isoleucine--tRNA ligase [Oscillospiraceae bacterium]|nr:isoleucine--tRNA ligase [Oscillospiraceae bacterium]